MPRVICAAALAMICVSLPSAAEPLVQIPAVRFGADAATQRPAVRFGAEPVSRATVALSIPAVRFDTAEAAQQGSAPPPVAFEYSDAYKTRAKIHKVASFATIPLFVTEAFLGQSLYSDPSSNKKTGHLVVAGGIGALFAVNTVTGVWNLLEARQDPSHRALRWAHGLLMLAADGGFLATAALGPSSEDGMIASDRSTHRAVAFTSIALASAGYVIMLFGNH